MTRAEAMEKVRKLLELANSENEHEAALAASMAERIMTRHEIDAAELDAPEDAEEVCVEWEDPLYTFGAKAPTWKSVLSHGLAKHFGCYTLQVRRKGGTVLFGRASNVATVRYFFEWISKEVERLAKKQGGNGRAWIAAYRHGCVSAVLAAMTAERAAQEAEARAAATGSALVVLDKALAVRSERRLEARGVCAQIYSIRAGRGVSVRSSGFEAGKRDGANIYGGHRPQLGAGLRRIGS